MSLEFKTSLDHAQKWTKFIAGRLAMEARGEDSIYQLCDPVKTRRGEMLFNLVVSSYEVSGLKNLDEVRDLLETGKQIIFTRRHETDLDYPLQRKALEENGYYDLVDRCYYLAGIKMWKRWQTTPFMPGENVVTVLTPYDLDELDKLKKLTKLSPSESKIIAEYDKQCQSLNEASKKHIQELRKKGMITDIFPESTRSIDGYLLRAPKRVGAYFYWGKEDTCIVPISSEGLRDGWPAKALPNIPNIVSRNVHGSIIFGKPYPAQEIWERDFSGLELDNQPATPVDYVMAKIARLNWGLVRDERERQFYQAVLNAPLKSSSIELSASS